MTNHAEWKFWYDEGRTDGATEKRSVIAEWHRQEARECREAAMNIAGVREPLKERAKWHERAAEQIEKL